MDRRTLILFALVLLLSGCIGYKPDQRVVGLFRSPSGEVVDVGPDGRIVYVATDKEELVGLVTIDRDDPLSIRVVAPDTSPLVGTRILFSPDRQSIIVEWQNMKGDQAARPHQFKKDAPP